GLLDTARMPSGGDWALGSSLRFDFDTLTIDSFNNRIGIGTANPSHELDVVGALNLSGPTARVIVRNPNNSGASFTLNWLNDVGRIRIGGSGAGAGNGFDFQGIGNASLLRITGGGNIGIGTTSPAAPLHVNGDARIDGTITIPTTTRTLTLSACSFATQNRTEHIFAGGGPQLIFSLLGSGDGSAMASVVLPDGAIVTKFAAALRDISTTTNITVELIRNDFATVSSATMASVSSTGDGGFQVRTDTSVSNTVIDSHLQYYALVQFPDGSPSSLLHAVRAVQITYTIITPLP
ncbi:MAG: hypothetical protein O7G85_09585, partial [Planctomycetota bacterium]|nr:hypothetical protein [Planctomycetota bacterium]